MTKVTYIFLIVLICSIAILIAVLGVTGCPTGTVEYRGDCYADPKAETDNIPSVKPSDERPPSEKLPSYQRPGIHADEPQSLSAQDAKEDEQRHQADAEGKAAAGAPK